MATGTIQTSMQVIEAEWTASSSNSSNTQLTAKATLTRGIYVAIIRTPTMSATPWGTLRGNNGDFNGTYFVLESMHTYTQIITITDATDEVYAVTGSSTNTSYTNKNYGGLQFLKVK